MTTEIDQKLRLYNKELNTIGILAGYTLRYIIKAKTIIEEVGTTKKLLVINNRDILEKVRMDKRFEMWTILEGSNSNGEYSAWQEALNYIIKNNIEYDKVIFANDTVNVHRCFTKMRLLLFCYRIVNSKNAYIGSFVRLRKNKRFMLDSIEDRSETKLKGYISTYLFALDKVALARLNNQIDYHDKLNSYINNEGKSSDDFFEKSLDLTLKNRLVHWLFSGKGWYKSEKLTKKNREMFRRKLYAY